MTYNSITTLNEIREHSPCADGWEKLLKHLGKTHADDEPLDLLTILESNGLDDALWCLRAKSLDRLSRHFQAWCADQLIHHFEAERPNDTRVRDQIAMLRNDDATPEQRDAAWAAAWDDRGRAMTYQAAEQALIWRGITPPKPYSRKTLCPQCSHKRTKRDQTCLSVYVDDDRVSWQCWHCEWQGEEYL